MTVSGTLVSHSFSTIARIDDHGNLIAGLAGGLAALFVALLIYQPTVIVGCIFVSFVTMALLNFDIFVVSLLFLLPWFRNAYLVLWFILFFGVWIRVRRQNASIRRWLIGSKRKKAMVFFGIVALVSPFLSGLSRDISTYRSLVLLLSYLLIFFAFDGWLQNSVQLSRILKILLMSTVGVALFGFWQAIAGGYTDLYFYLNPYQQDNIEPWSGRITSLLLQFNSLAGYLDLVIPVAMACAVLAKDRTLKLLGIACVGTAIIAEVLTQSRGGIIALVGIVILAAWFLTKSVAARLKLFCLCLIACVLIVPVLFNHFDRLHDIDDETQTSRLALWQAAAQMFIEHPVLGVGYGNYKVVYSSLVSYQGNLDAHNLYLQLLAETGVIGFVSFCAFVGAFLFSALRSMREGDDLKRIVAFGVVGAIAAIVIHGTVDFLLNAGPQFGMLFWLLLGIGSRVVNSEFHDTPIQAQ
jgi:putative inorganic carbon (HCO3(-)) transporter